MGFFDSGKRTFQEVPVINDKISTTEFLEAAETVVALFGTFNRPPYTIEFSDTDADSV